MSVSLLRTLYAPLPEWARPDNPVLRYVLNSTLRRQHWSLRLLTRLGWAALIAALLVLSYGFYNADNPVGMNGPRESALFTVLYFPLLVLQGVALLAALTSTSNVVADEQQRGTWEAFKITSHGAEMVIRARWAAAFYQMRWLLLILIVPRLLFAGMMLADLTDYQGYHLDLYIVGITPEVPVEAAILLLAALLTAALLQVLVMFGLNAALGLVISAYFGRQGRALLARLVVLGVEIVVLGLAFMRGAVVLNAEIGSRTLESMSMADRWGGLFALGTLGDLGLRFMDLRTFLQTWADVDYGVLLGAAILAGTAGMVVITNGLLMLAVRRAGRPARE